MVTNRTLANAIETGGEGDTPDWSEGTCDRCSRDEVQVLATVPHPEFDHLCLPCSDFEAENGDLSMLVRGGR